MKTISNVYAVCGFAAIGGGLFGMDIATMSGVLGTESYRRYFHHPVSYTQGSITASMPIGSIFGALSSSFVSDRFSRKIAIQVSCLLWVLGSAIQSGANGIPALCIGRFVSGVGVGAASAIVPVYQAEIAPKEIRGRIITLQQWAITWGILIQYFIQYACSFVDGGAKNPAQSTAAFRIPWGLQSIPAFILCIGLMWFPYSPRWLASQDRWEEAVTVLADLHAGGNLKHPKVLAQYREIEEALRFEKECRAAGWAALAEHKMAKRLVIGTSVQMFSGLSGMNVMMYYIVYIMESANIGSPLLTASIQYIINVAITLPAILYIDRWGRRPTLLLGSLSMATLLFISGALQAGYGSPVLRSDSPDAALSWHIVDNPPVSKTIVACSYLLVATFATTWGPVSWTYPAEIFPNRIRAKATSITTAANWIFNAALAFAVPPLLYSINWKMYMIFGTFNMIAFIQVFLMVPETKNFTLEEMDVVFEGRPWAKERPKESNLDDLEQQIACGALDVDIHKEGVVTMLGDVGSMGKGGRDGKASSLSESEDQKPIMVETAIEMTSRPRSSYESEGRVREREF
ncbi:general substrate transporter [Mytilinidion resinicola]|uniref:General substrate transporter n=1 Tax=Mytilinidion resinicola TaxID=574789 RepID=A0A6A6YI58_9PEZI|nr:general substrate transporter [Mytilinidion resinicola]KAF2807674.1 general substrate transporter [Mytilinidion resinicola]